MASPRQRAARWRYAQYAVLVAVVVVIALVADWGQLAANHAPGGAEERES